MKVEGNIKSVKLLTSFKGTGQLWMAGTVFEAKDGFPQDIKDEIGLNRLGVLNIEYEEPQADIPETVLPKEDPVEEIEEVKDEKSEEDIKESPPDKPKPKPKPKPRRARK